MGGVPRSGNRVQNNKKIPHAHSSDALYIYGGLSFLMYDVLYRSSMLCWITFMFFGFFLV
jgi:hypothetical protein